MPSPPLWEAGLVFGRGPTPTASCRRRPLATPSNAPDYGNPGIGLQGPWPDRLGCRPHGCGWPLVPRRLRCQG